MDRGMSLEKEVCSTLDTEVEIHTINVSPGVLLVFFHVKHVCVSTGNGESVL